MGSSLRPWMCLCLLAYALMSAPAHAETWRVDANQTSSTQDGSSWGTAFRYLEDAIQATQSHTDIDDLILVAQGTYFPGDTLTTPNNADRSESFVMRHRLVISGGYRGIAGLPNNADDRDPNIHVSILSGDLDEDDVGDLEDSSRDENSLVVVRGGTNTEPVDFRSVLDGFTIRDGHRDDSADEGAGIYVPPGSNPTLSNLIVTRNRVSNGEFGGGLLVRSEFGSLVPALTVSNCRFVDNKAGQGGGVALALYARADFEFCEFDSNAAHGLGGGGLLVYESSVADLTDCVVYDNTFTYGGGSPQGGGGLLAFKVCTLSMRRVRFESNRSLSSRGGGMVISEFSNVNFATDCQWTDNTAEMDEGGFGGVGGAVVFYNNANDNVGRFFNCLFQGNRAIPVPSQQSLGGGFYIEVNDAVEMANCLFFDQTAYPGTATGFRSRVWRRHGTCLTRKVHEGITRLLTPCAGRAGDRPALNGTRQL